jgi:uncharacterized repeat protein (TIGR02543 family)
LKKQIFAALALCIVSALCLTACGTVQTKFTVSFNSNSGNEVDSITTDGKSALSRELEIPEREAYEFKGWFVDSVFEIPFYKEYFVYNPTDKDITVYAKWRARELTGVEVLSYPVKKNYTVLENPDVTGGVLRLLYDDGKYSKVLDMEVSMVKNADVLDTVGDADKAITIVYSGYEFKYPVRVAARVQV